MLPSASFSKQLNQNIAGSILAALLLPALARAKENGQQIARLSNLRQVGLVGPVRSAEFVSPPSRYTFYANTNLDESRVLSPRVRNMELRHQIQQTCREAEPEMEWCGCRGG